ncbi:uncharacterized protein FTOL_13465 [Fusarium torulosum]|uniref:Uncharacterized protein n=1 Tax=Fusarium torulosum TaxID=33205 RepID=A0AAE8MMK1_9HYPO|nr:uncharacterized protein FTOL_13465 [Fusarium torulosum]
MELRNVGGQHGSREVIVRSRDYIQASLGYNRRLA